MRASALVAGGAIVAAVAHRRRASAQQAALLSVEEVLAAPEPLVAPEPIGEGGRFQRFPGPTRAELYQRARELGIEGRSTMNKAQLRRAVAEHGREEVCA